ncbi:MAG: trypsin-like peptidase domain-containing protein [Burkholderiales bacterium]|nr:trypsin-like peptidase domain-containing protein [Burkholderiales bacterium]
MARTPLYSRTPRRAAPGPTTADASEAAAPAPAGAESTAAAPPAPQPGRPVRERWAWIAGALVLAVVAGWPAWTLKLKPVPTIEQIDAALRESIAKEPLPSAAAAAYAAVLPSVVRVVGEQAAKPDPASARAGKGAPRAATRPGQKPGDKPGDKTHDEDGRSVGTGVVIVDNGLILTNLHVVAGADTITVRFFDGSESEAVVVSLQPENDLAVLRAKTIPDDLHAATLRSTAGLSPGDEVVAVGFPFGIGPSASQGVVSGLKREFRSPEGQRSLTNLIQFDAAANPGNSGGPLVTMDGHVVGIVTAIMNPNQQRTFIGIGFAVPIENAAAAVGMPPF